MSRDNELDAMTDEQAAEHYYRHRDEIEREVSEPVDIEPARPLSLARRLASVRRAVDDVDQLVQQDPAG